MDIDTNDQNNQNSLQQVKTTQEQPDLIKNDLGSSQVVNIQDNQVNESKLQKKYKPEVQQLFICLQLLNYKKFSGECLCNTDAIKRQLKTAFGNLSQEQLSLLVQACESAEQREYIKDLHKKWMTSGEY